MNYYSNYGIVASVIKISPHCGIVNVIQLGGVVDARSEVGCISSASVQYIYMWRGKLMLHVISTQGIVLYGGRSSMH